jgi:hypothetical protein
MEQPNQPSQLQHLQISPPLQLLLVLQQLHQDALVHLVQ